MRPGNPQPQPPAGSNGERWVDLREAEELTGIPASTIRNWARKRRIDSQFEMDESGDRRYVELSEVLAWADHLGRQHKNVASEEEVASHEAIVVDDSAIRDSRFADLAEPTPIEPPEEPDLAEDDVANRESRMAGVAPPTREDSAVPGPDEMIDTRAEELTTRDPAIPEGTMLVPLDAWNKMLNQLGNLHEAGQQLADARERAARAETEVQFLRERLSEMRDQSRSTTTDARPPEQAEEAPETIDPLWVDLYRRWKRRRN